MKRGLSSLLSSAVIGLVASGLAIGAVESIAAKPGHDSPRGPGPKKPPRKQVQVRQQAAEAKRLQRQARNLTHQSRGAYGARRA